MEALDELVEDLYRPPGLDRLKDNDFYDGLYALLQDEKFRTKFQSCPEDNPLPGQGKKMINVKLSKQVPLAAGCWFCGERIKQDTLYVEANFVEKGHESRVTRAHMYCADDFADGFQSEVTRRNEAELKERDNAPPVGQDKKDE